MRKTSVLAGIDGLIGFPPRWAQRAKVVGIQQPGKIRVYAVQEMPRPDNVELAKKTVQLGLSGPSDRGLRASSIGAF